MAVQHGLRYSPRQRLSLVSRPVRCVEGMDPGAHCHVTVLSVAGSGSNTVTDLRMRALRGIARSFWLRLQRRVVARRSSAFQQYKASQGYRRARTRVEIVSVQPGFELEVFSKHVPAFGTGVGCSVVVESE